MPDGARSDNVAVQRQLDRLNALSPGRDVLGLERIRELLARLGNPHEKLPPIFHIAGTNGKGSTCAFLRAMLEADGRRVHVYSSPHLVRFNERIRLAGTLIEDDYLAELLDRVIGVAEGLEPSFFEVTTAVAMLGFSNIPADVCVLEVGLGGRLDATNVIASPAVCGIAALGIDHERFLLAPEAGAPTEPMARIGWEKAGIAKTRAPLVTLDYGEAVNTAIDQQAENADAEVMREGRDWHFQPTDTGFTYRDTKGEIALPIPGLTGDYQRANAALAVAMLRAQNALTISDEAAREGILSARWPARLQKLSDGPLTASAPGATIWLDGGHNRSAGDALAAHFENAPDSSLHVIIGMLDNKDPKALVEPLASKIASLTVVPVPGHEWHAATAFGPMVKIANSVPEALTHIDAAPGSTILICGSLYLAGEVLRANDEAPT